MFVDSFDFNSSHLIANLIFCCLIFTFVDEISHLWVFIRVINFQNSKLRVADFDDLTGKLNLIKSYPLGYLPTRNDEEFLVHFPFP